jgi:glutamyl-tRNA synthetase
MARITPLIRERIKLLNDVLTVADFFFAETLAAVRKRRADPQEGRCRAGAAGARKGARRAGRREFSHDGLEAALRSAAADLGIKAGQMFEPVRVAVCGRKTAPPLFGTLEVLGRDVCLRRIDQAIGKLKTL